MMGGTVGTMLLINAGISAACFVVLWLISLRLQDVSFVDSWWALGIVLLALTTGLQVGRPGPHGDLLLVLCAAWGLRLGVYLLLRWRRNGPDPRYQAIMRHAKERRGWSFATTAGLQVFLLQGVLQFIVALPVQLGQIGGDRSGLGVLGRAGAVLAIIGILFESIGDWQLARFKRNPENKERVLDSGLWRYTRHPNYFGDACVGWGLYLIAAETSLGRWTIIAPLLLTFLLTRVSGVPMLESQLRKKRPDYAAYVAQTSTFIPWWPKRRT